MFCGHANVCATVGFFRMSRRGMSLERGNNTTLLAFNPSTLSCPAEPLPQPMQYVFLGFYFLYTFFLDIFLRCWNVSKSGMAQDRGKNGVWYRKWCGVFHSPDNWGVSGSVAW